MNTKNKQRARLALAELEKEMEVLSKEEMKACKGGETYIRRDPSGNIIFTPIGSGFQGHSDDRYSYMERGYIYADDGTKIEAYRNICCDDGFNTDCHGVTFADGKYWINNNQVNKILRGDRYRKVPEGNYRNGDVAVYYKNGLVVHTLTLSTTNGRTDGSIGVGLGGVDTEISSTALYSGYHDYDEIKIYRK